MSAARRRRRPELSQHFLRRGVLARSLIAAASIDAADCVLEIGPGTGALTDPLSRCARRVVAVELDPALAGDLQRRFAGAEHVQVVHADALHHPFPREPVRVVASVPFAITSRLVRRILAEPSVVDTHLIVQREAAERLAGAPFAHESLPSLTVKPWWHAEMVRQLKRTDFDPPPRVDCAVLWLARRSPPLVAERDRPSYERFLRTGFGRRRTMRQALRDMFTNRQARRLAADLRIPLDAPPSATRFDQWLGLFRFWHLLQEARAD